VPYSLGWVYSGAMGTVLVALLVACILAAVGVMVFGDDY
jgi:hypothetical protein